MTKLLNIFFILLSILLVSCSASTGNRYEKNEKEKSEEKDKTSKKKYEENFDITPYRTKVNIEEEKNNTSAKDLNAWYNYENAETPDTSFLHVRGHTNGYRVQVVATDNLQQADSIKSELPSITNSRAIYISFDPPFYKVKVGDFINISDAKNLSFKLNQLGYSEARVINDKINLFK